MSVENRIKGKVDPQFIESVRRLAGRGSVVIAYGSYFNDERAKSSKPDLLVVTPDVKEFHARNLWEGWIRYGFPANFVWHAILNSEGPSYYQGRLPVGNTEIPIKVGVISTEQFHNHARGAKRGAGKGHYYVAGRLQKLSTFILIPDDDPQKQALIDHSIRTAIFDGFDIALSKVGNNFRKEELLKPYVESSYLADTPFRPDHPNSYWRRMKRGVERLLHIKESDQPTETKVDRLLRFGQDEYLQMLDTMLSKYCLQYIIEPNPDGSYIKKYSKLSKEDVDDWLKVCSRVALGISIKNWVTSGVLNGFLYFMAKALRRHKN